MLPTISLLCMYIGLYEEWFEMAEAYSQHAISPHISLKLPVLLYTYVKYTSLSSQRFKICSVPSTVPDSKHQHTDSLKTKQTAEFRSKEKI